MRRDEDDRAILVIGAGGQLGGEFVQKLRRQQVPLVLASSVEKLQAILQKNSLRESSNSSYDMSQWRTVDVGDDDSLVKLIDEVQPRVVINASAYTAVDLAETNQAIANAINAKAPKIMAAACASHGAVLVHFSTDYVFDGCMQRAYTEQDIPRPLNEYGLSKLRGEQAVLEVDAGHFVFRTSWLYTPGQRNFVTTMLRLFRGDSPVRVVDDQFGCPTWARDLASVIANWVVHTPTQRLKDDAGLYHLCSAGECCWHEFAAAIRERMVPAASANLLAINSAVFNAAASRPARSVLDCSRAREVLKLQLPGWLEALDAAMPEFNSASDSSH